MPITITANIDFEQIKTLAKNQDFQGLEKCCSRYNEELPHAIKLGAYINSLSGEPMDYAEVAIRLLRNVCFNDDEALLGSLYSYINSLDTLCMQSTTLLSKHVSGINPKTIKNYFASIKEPVHKLFIEAVALHELKTSHYHHEELIPSPHLGDLMFTEGQHTKMSRIFSLLSWLTDKTKFRQICAEMLKPESIKSDLLMFSERDEYLSFLYCIYSRNPERYEKILSNTAIPKELADGMEPIDMRTVIYDVLHSLLQIEAGFAQNLYGLFELETLALDIIRFGLFYHKLSEFSEIAEDEEQDIEIVALLKLIRAKNMPGLNPIQFQSQTDFCLYFTSDERHFLSAYDYTLCVLQLYHFSSDYTANELAYKVPELLCAQGREGMDMIEYNVTTMSEFDDDGNLLNLEYPIGNPATVIKEVFINKGRIKSGVGVISRWLNAFSKEDIPDAWRARLSPEHLHLPRLIELYDELIQDCVKADHELAARLTHSVYHFLDINESSDVLEYNETLNFFKAYYSKNEQLKIDCYQRTIDFGSDYVDSARNNLAVIYIQQEDYVSALEQIDGITDEELRNSIESNWKVEFAEYQKKAASREKLAALLKVNTDAMPLTETSDENLIYMAAACLCANNSPLDYISHNKNYLSSWLLPSFELSHQEMRKLIQSDVFTLKNEHVHFSSGDELTPYDVTSQALVPHSIDYVELEHFTFLLEEELKKRTFSEETISDSNNRLKHAWLLSSLEYQVDKFGYGAEKLDITKESEDIIVKSLPDFSSAHLSSIAYNVLNFVAGSQKRYGFSDLEVRRRIIPRLITTFDSANDYKNKLKTYPRNKSSAFGIERVLYYLDEMTAAERYEQC